MKEKQEETRSKLEPIFLDMTYPQDNAIMSVRIPRKNISINRKAGLTEIKKYISLQMISYHSRDFYVQGSAIAYLANIAPFDQERVNDDREITPDEIKEQILLQGHIAIYEKIKQYPINIIKEEFKLSASGKIWVATDYDIEKTNPLSALSYLVLAYEHKLNSNKESRTQEITERLKRIILGYELQEKRFYKTKYSSAEDENSNDKPYRLDLENWAGLGDEHY